MSIESIYMSIQSKKFSCCRQPLPFENKVVPKQYGVKERHMVTDGTWNGPVFVLILANGQNHMTV